MTEQTIVAVVDDIMFLSRLEQHVKALDYRFRAVDKEADITDAISDGVALGIVDLHTRGLDWRTAVTLLKDAGLPVLAFGRHTEVALLREARDAGCDRVVARSQLVEELPALLHALESGTAPQRWRYTQQRMTTTTQYEVVIGIEVHAQLATQSKMFCGCATGYHNAPPNTHTCPVCLGMPGMLPVINRRAVELTIMTGLALNCSVPERAKFDRKNYPYPDLPKGYQISQYDLPLCKGGWLEVEVEGETKRIGITRVHLEEDTGRSMHRSSGVEDYSLVDFNRSGTPLMEIVTEPDIRSGKEARAYVMKLQQILRYVGASRANLEEGNMRCEPNISLRPAGSTAFGTKVELKNLNSFRAVELGVQFEVERQSKLLDAGDRVVQETRGWRDDTGETVSQRSKEQAEDYRYFPEPDLPPVAIPPQNVEELRASLPELPDEKRKRFETEYGLTEYEANLLTSSTGKAAYFEEAARTPGGGQSNSRAKAVSNWMLGDFARLTNIDVIEPQDSRVTPDALSELIDLIDEKTVSVTGAKNVFEDMYTSGKRARAIVEEQGLTQISSSDELTGMVAKVIEANPKPVADFQGGKDSALKALVGLVMRETRGRANPQLAEELLRKQLGDS